MNIIFIVQMKIHVLIEWSYSPPPQIRLTYELRMVNILSTQSNLFNMCLFLFITIVGATPINHIPLKWPNQARLP